LRSPRSREYPYCSPRSAHAIARRSVARRRRRRRRCGRRSARSVGDRARAR
jgi:hypothetical protein